MTHTIRINKRGPRDLYFDVESGTGHRIATSSPFDTICRLESGLTALIAATQRPELVLVERNDHTTSIGSSLGRKRVRFVGCLEDTCVRDLLSGVVTARVADERPNGHRRADLSGRLCELGH